jgi:hypothetical protein
MGNGTIRLGQGQSLFERSSIGMADEYPRDLPLRSSERMMGFSLLSGGKTLCVT